ncbi:hypothetical protein ScPMuIL_017153 [Solemya velum]
MFVSVSETSPISTSETLPTSTSETSLTSTSETSPTSPTSPTSMTSQTSGECDCPSNTRCVWQDDGSYICKCLEGYMGDCDVCEDIDECATDTADCPNHSECVNTEGSYYCNCDDGFVSYHDKCVDFNECREYTDDCPTNSVCVNMYGTYDCICCNGYEDDGEGNCEVSSEEQTTGQECCICSGNRCDEEGEVCDVNGNTYNSMRDLIIAECEQDTQIEINYLGACQSSCDDVSCPRYQNCAIVDGLPTCQCQECSSSDYTSGTVCSESYQTYDNLCVFYERMCEFDLEQDSFLSDESCENLDDPVGDWSEWGDCSVTCGKGVKTRTRDLTRTLYDNEPEIILSRTADCYEDTCPNGPCDGFDCDNEAMECDVSQTNEPICECPSCDGEGRDPVCGVVGDRMQTFSNLCRLQRKACLDNATYELLHEDTCSNKPLNCSLFAKFEKISINDCITEHRKVTHYCSGGCGDNPGDCCEPISIITRTATFLCSSGPETQHYFEPTACVCTPES